MRVSRRGWLAGTSALSFSSVLPGWPALAASDTRAVAVEPAPLGAVRLKPSLFADAVAANRAYLRSLDPQRFLHNFYLSAGLEAPKPIYGGWESLGVAGQSLGHWLSSVSILLANGPDPQLAAALDLCLTEMGRIQAAHGDGYCAGTVVERDGQMVDGKIIFEEVRRGDISSHGFDLNGGWVPLYTWHKIHAGLIAANSLARNPKAMPIMLGIADYLAGVLEPLTDEQMQQVLAAEHGGLNETYAETYRLTGDERWLRMARKIYHRAVLDPLVAEEDRLAGLHANTQIPKVIGLARLHELTGNRDDATAARFFHRTVRNHHSYVIGGNSEREHFGPPDRYVNAITEATCEACNSYNMLKLTRHLYQWQPDASLFDYYERVQLNHIMAHQRPDDGRFVYFMPLAAGSRRIYSEPEDSFWCCVGSGMESHSKHMDSIFWADDRTLYINLYIASELEWPTTGFALSMETEMPVSGTARLMFDKVPRGSKAVALRMPGWSDGISIRLNGDPARPEIRNGYAVIDRMWVVGDVLEIDLPMQLGVESVPDDPSVVAFTHGPLVLAADLGPADEDFAGLGPALVTQGAALEELQSIAGDAPHFAATDAMGAQLDLRPFFDRYDRRTAIYFPTFSPDQWAANKQDYIRAQEMGLALAQRTIDTMYLGEMQPERDHGFVAGQSEVVNWNGRSARRIPPGSSVEMTLARKPGPGVLRITVWGADVERPLAIAVDGDQLKGKWPVKERVDDFVALDFPLPNAGEQGRAEAVITITALKEQALVYGLRMLAPEAN